MVLLWAIGKFNYYDASLLSLLRLHQQPPANICKASTWHTERERAVAIVAVLAIWGGGCSDPNDSKTVFVFLYTYSSEAREIDTFIECCTGIVCFVAVYVLIGLCLLYRPVYLIWHLHCTPHRNISSNMHIGKVNTYLLYTHIYSHLTCRYTYI
jgi:hypothetical protein